MSYAAELPIFITYRDRRTMLDRCVESLTSRGLENITIIDNDSLYPLDGYPFPVIRTDNRYRHLAAWELGLVPKQSHYVVMDQDIELECPDDVMQHLMGLLIDYPSVYKIGLGIKTSDLPTPVEHYRNSFEVERRYASRAFHACYDGSMRAELLNVPVDTHFAMYRPGATGWGGIVGARTARPYACRHLPWYNEDFTEEERLYYRRAGHAWAESHSAGKLVSMATFVPFTALRAETIVALTNAGEEFIARPILDDESYYYMLAEQWAAGDTFAIIEQDIAVAPETLAELRECSSGWCAAPYEFRGDKFYGLGAVKFSHELIARNPQLPAVIADWFDELHTPRHWCRLDAWVYKYLTNRGEDRHEHVNRVGHVKAVAHKC